ncbi:MAG: Zn-ribbon domain-containing OB-fold protein [Methanosarcinaceae archaeon]|jgi:uncharacterized OB-fold protein|nr:Zn-ribbon domain-containing OB-fold protein [Methanosarcinaceae archaeon]NKQ39390.1 Zn-ribbon domain-containing OB-fold protein [Methanosarcinales archaeon]
MTVARFWRMQQARYNLKGTHCNSCNEYFYPPRNLCPMCRRTGNVESYKFKGKGQVVTYTVIHTKTEELIHRTPYILAIVKMDEGPRFTTQIIEEPENMSIGMRVKPVFRKLMTDDDKGMIVYGTKFVKD